MSTSRYKVFGMFHAHKAISTPKGCRNNYLKQLHRQNQEIQFRFSDTGTAHRFCYFLWSLTNIFKILPAYKPNIFSVIYISSPLIKKIFKEFILADFNAIRIKIQQLDN